VSLLFETKEAAEELNSHCVFCGLLKFKVMELDGRWVLARHIPYPDSEYCQFNHQAEVVYRPVGEHDDTMMIVRGG